MRKSRKICVDCNVQLGILSAYINIKRCHSCNARANINRIYWRDIYTNKIKGRGFLQPNAKDELESQKSGKHPFPFKRS